MIVRTSLDDLDKVTNCHIATFPNSLATKLGFLYCKKMLSWYLTTDKTFLIHLEDELGNCIGYCGAMISDGTLATGSASGMFQHSLRIGILAFFMRPWLFFHPDVIGKWKLVKKNILMRLGLHPNVHYTPKELSEQSKSPTSNIVVIGVDPKYHGRGLGSKLLKSFEEFSAKEFKIFRFRLSVNKENERAITSYKRNGWIISQSSGNSITMDKFILP